MPAPPASSRHKAVVLSHQSKLVILSQLAISIVILSERSESKDLRLFFSQVPQSLS
jgi:hypothetical protein